MRRGDGRRARAVALLAVWLAAAACRYPATEVLVELDSDAPAGRTLRLRALAVRGATPHDDAGAAVELARSAGALPFTFGLVPGAAGARDGTATLVVEAELSGEGPDTPAVRFRRVARFAFTPRRRTRVALYLPVACAAASRDCERTPAASCTVAARCDERGLTCGDEGTCVQPEVTPAPEDTDAPVGPRARDATARDAPSLDAPRLDAADADLDAGSDAPDAAADAARCVPRPDAGVDDGGGARACTPRPGACDIVTQLGCPSGSGCFFTTANTSQCMAAGTRPFNATCGATSECAGGLCVGINPLDPVLRCRQFCCPLDDGPCQDPARGGVPGARCVPVVSTAAVYLGVCVQSEPCTLFGSGCTGAEWCLPLAPTGGTFCGLPGNVATGAACMHSGQCLRGDLCVRNRCRRMCDATACDRPDAAAAARCPIGSACVYAGTPEFPPEIGTCEPVAM